MSNAELRQLVDFQQGDILAIPEGNAEVVEVIREGESITLVYTLYGKRKQLTGLCTKLYSASSRSKR